MNNITLDRCRQRLLDNIDKVLGHRFLSWLSNEDAAILNGVRSLIVTDDAFVQKIASSVGPFTDRQAEKEFTDESAT